MDDKMRQKLSNPRWLLSSAYGTRRTVSLPNFDSNLLDNFARCVCRPGSGSSNNYLRVYCPLMNLFPCNTPSCNTFPRLRRQIFHTRTQDSSSRVVSERVHAKASPAAPARVSSAVLNLARSCPAAVRVIYACRAFARIRVTWRILGWTERAVDCPYRRESVVFARSYKCR